MLPCQLVNPIPLPLDLLAPTPQTFARHSSLHGQPHVSRVIVHSLLLLQARGFESLAAPLWAAAYIHDIGRRHDGRCNRHGRYALERLASLPQIRATLIQGGVRDADWPGIEVAVENHCCDEIPELHPHRTLTALLKDADALDRVRLGDLEPRYLRFPESLELVPFARVLYERSQDTIPPGPEYFSSLWAVAQKCLSEMPQPSTQLCEEV